MRVLLVDDEVISNFIHKKLFEHIGFRGEIDTARNGVEALEWTTSLFNKSGVLPDIILVDINMPLMNGFDFLEAFNSLRGANTKFVKIIVVSSSANSRDVDRAKTMGVSQFITKPLTADVLRIALE